MLAGLTLLARRDERHHKALTSFDLLKPAIRFMKNRFSDLNLEQRGILRALKLLAAAGVLPFTQERIQAVLEHIFKRSPSNLANCLYALADQAFLHPSSQEPVDPEPAYLRDAVSYTEGKDPEDDFAKLADVLKEQKDHEGLFYLGTTYSSNLEAYQPALTCFKEALRLDPDALGPRGNMGVTLHNLGEYHKALEAYDEVLRLNPHEAMAWLNKNATLANLSEYQEALEAIDKALKLNPDYRDAWHSKGVALANLNEYQKALEAFDEALQRLAMSMPHEASYNQKLTQKT